MFVLNVFGIVPVLRPGRFHDAETLVRTVRVPDRPPEVVPVGFASFVDHSASFACGFGFRFVLAALRRRPAFRSHGLRSSWPC